MTNPSSLRLEMQGGLAIVSLTQPTRGNPFDGDFVRDFKQVFSDLWDTPALRAVRLRADGDNFGVGGDLKPLHPHRAKLPTLVRRMTVDLHRRLQRAWQLPVLIGAAVQGWAMGGSAFARIGFSCDSDASATLTMRMGAAQVERRQRVFRGC